MKPLQRKKRLERHTKLRAKRADSLKRRTRMRYRAKAKTKDAVKVMPDGREICQNNHAGDVEYGRRRDAMAIRQKHICAICGLLMYYGTYTFDHEEGRGGGKRDDRIEIDGKPINAAVHGCCNTEKGSRRIPYLYQVQAEVSA